MHHILSPQPLASGHNTPSVSVLTEPHMARIRYVGEISHAGADQLEHALDIHRSYYHYRLFDVCWDSQGGCVWAMRRIMSLLDRLRMQGTEISTSSAAGAFSAAAVLLSYGPWGERSVAPHTQLLYHRTGAHATSQRVTESDASKLKTQLKQLDAELIDFLLCSALRSVGGSGLQIAVMSRSAWLAEHWSQVTQDYAQRGGSAGFILQGQRPPAWVSPSKLQTCSNEAQWLDGYRSLLSQMLSKEQGISPLQAWCWGLIDRIHGVLDMTSVDREYPQLVPCHEEAPLQDRPC